MRTITPIGLLIEAKKYTNRSVSNAFLELARKYAFKEGPAEEIEQFEELYHLIQNEIIGCVDESREKNYEFISVKQYAEDLSECGTKISEVELLQELVCANLLMADEEDENFNIIGASLTAVDKGYIKKEGDDWFISPAGMFIYQRWKDNDGKNYWKNNKV